MKSTVTGVIDHCSRCHPLATTLHAALEVTCLESGPCSHVKALVDCDKQRSMQQLACMFHYFALVLQRKYDLEKLQHHIA